MPSVEGEGSKVIVFLWTAVNYLLPSTEHPEMMEHFSCARKTPVSWVWRIKAKNLLQERESSACTYCSLHELPVTLLWILGVISISLVSCAAGYKLSFLGWRRRGWSAGSQHIIFCWKQKHSSVQLTGTSLCLCVHILEGSVETSGQQWQCSLEKGWIKLGSFLFQNLFSEIKLHALLLKWTEGNKPCFFGWPKSVFS